MSTANILGVVGGVIGFIYGGPQGAQIGFMIGSAIGGYIDPTQIKGPKLTDATQQTAQEGVPIPFGYGTFPCAGNIVWVGPVVEHEQKDDGKGSGVENITYTYTRSYAIGICEGPINGIQKVWRNGKLVYDISPTSTIVAQSAKFLQKATFYLGTETQLVDPTIEADVGVNNSGPMRGLAYMVMENDETQQGEVAQYEFVVQLCGTVTSSPGGIENIASFYYPLQSDFVDVKDQLLDLVPTAGYSFAGVGVQFDGVGAKVAQGSGVDGASAYTISVKFLVQEGPNSNAFIAAHITNAISGYYNWSIGLTGNSAPFLTPYVSINGSSGIASADIVTGAPVGLGEAVVITLHRTPTTLSMYQNGGFVGSVPTSGTFAGSAQFSIGDAYFVGSIGHLWGVTRAITNQELLATVGAAGGDSTLVYAVPDAPDVYVDQDGALITDLAAQSEISSCGAILGDIVADLCERAGVEAHEYYVSQLTDVVAGFKCATEAGADAFIESLSAAFFFDRGEWDKKLRFIKRGGASVANLTPDDLVKMEGPPIKQTMIQEPELLRKVNVMTLDPEADYKLTKQSWERRAGTIKAIGEATVEIPVVTDKDTAAGIAKKRGLIAWSETSKFHFGLNVKWSKLTPTDIVTLTDKDVISHRIRLSDMNEQSGVLEITEAVKDRASVYGMTATGASNPNTGSPTTPGLSGPTLFAAMNLPQLRSQDPPGLWLGAAGILSTWPGCKIYMSVDAGVSYVPVKTITVPTKMGTLSEGLGVGSASEPLMVHIFGGQLVNKTAAQVATGANYSAIETLDSAGKVAEIIAYQTANVTSAGNDYRLSVITRALLGTAENDHFVDDQFMDLSSAYFLPVDVSYAGQTLYFKAVAFGVSLDTVTPITVVYSPEDIVIDGGEIT